MDDLKKWPFAWVYPPFARVGCMIYLPFARVAYVHPSQGYTHPSQGYGGIPTLRKGSLCPPFARVYPPFARIAYPPSQGYAHPSQGYGIPTFRKCIPTLRNATGAVWMLQLVNLYFLLYRIGSAGARGRGRPALVTESEKE
jgi:hypothetical protein